jgi:hypothetical protein
MHPGPPQANPKWKIHRGLHTLRLGTTSSYYAVSPGPHGPAVIALFLENSELSPVTMFVAVALTVWPGT